MKIPDVNVLINAVNEESPHNGRAIQWIENQYNSTESVNDGQIGYAWMVLIGFIRISTRKGILKNSLTVDASLSFIDQLLNHPAARIIEPTERHMGIVGRLLLGAGTAGNLTMDAHLAALAIEHNAEVITFDSDFKQFAGLRFDLLK
jgi:uncharacterized protein